MNISSLNEILKGALLNKPNVSRVDSFADKLNRVSFGDCFFCNNNEHINQAIKQGAYVVVTSKDIKTLNEDTAYIKVDTLKKAKIRLIRYLLNKHNVDFWIVSKEYAKLYKCFKRYQNSFLLSGKVGKDFGIVLKALGSDNGCVLLSDDEEYAKLLYPLAKNMSVGNYVADNNIEGCFYSSFVYQNTIYKQTNLPSMYVNMFLDISSKMQNIKHTAKQHKSNSNVSNALFENISQDFIIKKEIPNLDNFLQLKPMYFDYNLTLSKQATNRFVIASKIASTYNDEVLFLKEKFANYSLDVVDYKDMQDKNAITSLVKNKLAKAYSILYIKNISYKKIFSIFSMINKDMRVVDNKVQSLFWIDK